MQRRGFLKSFRWKVQHATEASAIIPLLTVHHTEIVDSCKDVWNGHLRVLSTDEPRSPDLARSDSPYQLATSPPSNPNIHPILDPLMRFLNMCNPHNLVTIQSNRHGAVAL